MTDAPRAIGADDTVHRSDAAKRRLARRYAAERRFKYLGLGAVLTAVAALLILLSTVVFQGLPAFIQNYATIPIAIPAADIDPQNPGGANFRGILNDAVEAALPFAQDRAEKRVARALMSDGASLILREEVLRNPDLVGGTSRVALPMSDTADLYLKGLVLEKEPVDVSGRASPSALEGDVTVTMDRGATARIRDDASATLRQQAGRLRREAGRVENAVAAQTRNVERIQAELNDASPEARAALETDLQAAEEQLAASQTRLDGLRQDSQALLAEADAPTDTRDLGPTSPSYLLSINGGTIKVTAVTETGLRGLVLVPLKTVETAGPGEWRLDRIPLSESERQISDQEIAYIDALSAEGYVEARPNWLFFTRGASREPEMAGIWGAVVGSFLTLLVTLALSFPLGVSAAIYLEEFAPKNRWTDLIEVNINNLAAVPSIVFGLLGLAVFLNFFGLPRSAPLVGGMVLALMTLPTIIIASRAALKSVPPSIREAALGIGASKIQTVFHHVLPLAMPGMMTGTIIGMAQALGETAPLLMIGMVAFIVDVPGGFTQPATVLPVQIFMWADFPEQAFRQKTSAAILVLLAFLILMNLLAVVLRRRFERRW